MTLFNLASKFGPAPDRCIRALPPETSQMAEARHSVATNASRAQGTSLPLKRCWFNNKTKGMLEDAPSPTKGRRALAQRLFKEVWKELHQMRHYFSFLPRVNFFVCNFFYLTMIAAINLCWALSVFPPDIVPRTKINLHVFCELSPIITLVSTSSLGWKAA